MKFTFRSIDSHELNSLAKDLEWNFENAVKWAEKSIREISVTVRDCNGPKGGVDKVCRVCVSLTRARRLILEDRDSNVYAALARLVERTSRTVHNVLDKKRSRTSIRYLTAMEQQG